MLSMEMPISKTNQVNICYTTVLKVIEKQFMKIPLMDMNS